MQDVIIDGRKIGPGHDPYIIAELSGNHEGSTDRAKAIIDMAAEAGADALKLQTYTPDTLTIDCDKPDFMVGGGETPWEGRKLYDLYQEAHTPWDWHEALFAHAKLRGITCFSTPFDTTAVDFLEELGAPAYKIASFENNWPELIAHVARTGKPMIMSTGASDLATINQAVSIARANGCENPIILKCTSSYPADASAANIITIPHMAQLFGCQVGISDHTLGIGVSVAAVALGATVVEKHVTLSKDDKGVDASFSLDGAELRALKDETRRAAAAIGKVQYHVSDAEKSGQIFKRSLYFVRDLAAGEVVDETAVRVIRPGYGLAPHHLPHILGLPVARAVSRGDAVSWAAFDKSG